MILWGLQSSLLTAGGVSGGCELQTCPSSPGCIAKTFYQYEQLSHYWELRLHIFPYTYIKQALMQLRYEIGDETSMQAVLV